MIQKVHLTSYGLAMLLISQTRIYAMMRGVGLRRMIVSKVLITTVEESFGSRQRTLFVFEACTVAAMALPES